MRTNRRRKDLPICTEPGCNAFAFYPSKLTAPGQTRTAPSMRCYTHRPQPAVRKPPPPPEDDDMPRFAPNRDLLEEIVALPHAAAEVSAALEHIAREFAIADSLPTQTPGAAPPIARFYAACHGKGGWTLDEGQRVYNEPCPGCDLCEPQHYTAVERAALARLRLSRNGEQLREDIRAYKRLRESIVRVSSMTLGIRIPVEVKRCDGRQFEGSQLPWTPHSRDERNGWRDATCADAADASGLCNRCRVREARWRKDNGLPPREHNASTPAAPAA